MNLLGINIDNKLQFDKYVLEICYSVGMKVSSLAQVLKLISFRKQRALFKILIESQFKYCLMSGCSIIVQIIGSIDK